MHQLYTVNMQYKPNLLSQIPLSALLNNNEATSGRNKNKTLQPYMWHQQENYRNILSSIDIN